MNRSLPQALAPLMVAAAVAAVSGCAALSGSTGASASATLNPTTDFGTQGVVTFEQTARGLVVDAKITGLRPNAVHGFAIHEKGDCSLDALNAGGHFNPFSAPHGPQGGAHHAGDLPNLRADASGSSQAHFELALPKLAVGAADVRGLALVVHDRPDDFTTQPTGNTGARRACGLIVAAPR